MKCPLILVVLATALPGCNWDDRVQNHVTNNGDNAANAIAKRDHSLASDAELIAHAKRAIDASETKRK
ncbi:MAG: hypothetical protein ACRC7Q_08870, partial [Plesiomonas shigelloides]